MLFISDVPLSCINAAAHEYQVPAKLIISVLQVEQGKVGLAKRNKNGTYDLGPMQINTSWWPKLASYGVTLYEVQYDPCVNVKVGAWVLADAIATGHDLLSGIGNYNSHTPYLNAKYTQWVRVRYTHLNGLLAER